MTAKGGRHAWRERERDERRQAKQAAKQARRQGGPSRVVRTDAPTNSYGGPPRPQRPTEAP
jgi:hypothetical protein